MNEELKQLLAELNKALAQTTKAAAVQTAANTPAPAAGDNPAAGGDPKSAALNPEENEIESKGLRGPQIDEKFVDPLRKNFEQLAKASPVHFGQLGAMRVLEDPYSYLREKNADGTYKIPTHQLDLMMRGMAAVNDTREKALAAGATEMGDWTEQSGNQGTTVLDKMYQAAQGGQFGQNSESVQKTLDTSVGAALIRTDIEPILRETFLRYFPAYDALAKIPANGLKHTWNQKTAFGSAAFVSELGSLSATASDSTYTQQQSTNIAVIASQRSVGLKAMFASQQSGMNFNLTGAQNNEVVSAVQAIANLVQATIFQGNEAVGTGTISNEDGVYNTLGFTGLRQQLKGAGYSITKSSETYLQILNRAAGQLFDAGADLASVLMFLSVGAMNAVSNELQNILRILKGDQGGAVPANLAESGLTLLAGLLARPQMVPAQGTQANGIGYYTYSAAATEDIYVLDPMGTAMPYLGSPNPTILQLPLGYNNMLAQVYIPFMMVGLAVYVKNFNRKIRIPQQTL